MLSALVLAPLRPPRVNVPMPVPNARPLAVLMVVVLFCRARALLSWSVPEVIVVALVNGLAAARVSIPLVAVESLRVRPPVFDVEESGEAKVTVRPLVWIDTAGVVLSMRLE